MKRIKSLIKLTNRDKESLNEKEQSRVIGGHCMCGCWYSDCGGSSDEANRDANADDNLGSEWPEGDAEWNYAH